MNSSADRSLQKLQGLENQESPISLITTAYYIEDPHKKGVKAEKATPSKKEKELLELLSSRRQAINPTKSPKYNLDSPKKKNENMTNLNRNLHNVNFGGH